MAKRTSIIDIAGRVGVSHTTVSLALRGSSEISAKRREQIQKIAKEMDYYPQAAGQLLVSKTTGQLGLIVASKNSVTAFESNPMSRMIGHFIAACIQRKCGYLIEFHHHDTDVDGFTPPRMVAGQLVDAVLAVSDVGEPLRHWLDDVAGIPWISVGEPARHCVLSDDQQALFAMTKQLVDLGHRRIALEIGPLRYASHRHRLDGFRRAVKMFQLPVDFTDPQWIHEGSIEEDIKKDAQDNMDWARSILRRPDRPTAVLCTGSARSFVHAALELGLHVPDDLSLVGQMPSHLAESQLPCITSIDTNIEVMMRVAMEQLDQLRANQKIAPFVHRIIPHLSDGQTMAPVPKEVYGK